MNFWYLLLAIALAIALIWIVNGSSFAMDSNPVNTSGFFRGLAAATTCTSKKCGGTSPAVTAATVPAATTAATTMKQKATAPRRSW